MFGVAACTSRAQSAIIPRAGYGGLHTCASYCFAFTRPWRRCSSSAASRLPSNPGSGGGAWASSLHWRRSMGSPSLSWRCCSPRRQYICGGRASREPIEQRRRFACGEGAPDHLARHLARGGLFLLGALFFATRLPVTPTDSLAPLRGHHVATPAAPRLDLYDRRSVLRRVGQRGSNRDCLCRRQRCQTHACGKNNSNEGFHPVSLHSLMKESLNRTMFFRQPSSNPHATEPSTARSASRTADAASIACTRRAGSSS